MQGDFEVMKPGPKPLQGTAMTHAERQARYRARQEQGAPKLRYRKLADRRSRPQRWRDAVAELLEMQDGYQAISTCQSWQAWSRARVVPSRKWWNRVAA